MHRPHPIRDAAIALTTLTAIPTPEGWLAAGQVQAAGWFPAVGGILGAAGYGVVKLAESTRVLSKAPFAVACVVVVVWAVLTGGLHWRALASVVESLLARLSPRSRGVEDARSSLPRQTAARDESAPRRRMAAAAITAALAAGEAAILGSFIVMHQSPVLCIPLLARLAATASAWLGKPVPADSPGRALFGTPSVVSAVVSAATVALATLALWTGFAMRGLSIAVIGVAAGLVVPHALSLAFGGVTLDVMESSVVLAEILTFAAFAARL
jgi:cobalamin synthase